MPQAIKPLAPSEFQFLTSYSALRELRLGTPVYDEQNNKLGYSKVAAQSGIGQVIFSRICMALPGMVVTPIVMDYLEKRGTLCRYPWMTLPTSVGILGLCLTFATPLACAFFKQKASIPFKHLEPELKGKIIKRFCCAPPAYVYYYPNIFYPPYPGCT
ncbi:hypothetical protein JTB14_006927 [Gonioctena quinquepunctata]|nr:hypothetical protein JTB14_006927 [Gonioctena quinquepunctata]